MCMHAYTQEGLGVEGGGSVYSLIRGTFVESALTEFHSGEISVRE